MLYRVKAMKKLTSQSDILYVAMNNGNEQVCLAAIEMLTDQEMLAGIAKTSDKKRNVGLTVLPMNN